MLMLIKCILLDGFGSFQCLDTARKNCAWTELAGDDVSEVNM